MKLALFDNAPFGKSEGESINNICLLFSSRSSQHFQCFTTTGLLCAIMGAIQFYACPFAIVFKHSGISPRDTALMLVLIIWLYHSCGSLNNFRWFAQFLCSFLPVILGKGKGAFSKSLTRERREESRGRESKDKVSKNGLNESGSSTKLLQ